MHPFTPNDLQQIESRGATVDGLSEQIETFRRGLSPLEIARPCSVDDGVIALSAADIARDVMSEIRTRLNFLEEQKRWKAKRVFLSPENSLDLTSGMAIAAGLLVLTAWMVPSSFLRIDSVRRAWNQKIGRAHV